MEHKIPGISGKSDNLERLTKIFKINFARISVPFDSVPEFPEFLVEWKAPKVYIRLARFIFSTVN